MATALTQADVDKLERAIALGVRTVQYANGQVTYQDTASMLRALAYAKNQLLSAAQQQTPSTYAVFNRDGG